MPHVPMSQGFPRVLWALLLVVGLLPIAGCSGNVERKWSEEVELDDGKVIVIDRFAMFKESNSLAGDAYNATDLTSRLGFQGELEALPVWSDVLVPILLYHDVGSQQWVIVATTSNCDTWYQNGGPVPPYWEYRISDGKWLKTSLSETSIGRKTNLFFSYVPDLPARKLSREMKNDVLKQNDFEKKYLSIVGDLKRDCMKREG